MRFFDFPEIIEKDTEFVIFGVPWDYLTSIDRANSSIAPEMIRKASMDLALTTEFGMEIPSLKVTDLGDVKIQDENVEKNIENIQKFVVDILKQKQDVVPIMIGGDHFCTYPVVKSLGTSVDNNYKMGILIFDAHIDFYDEWDKGIYSHATVVHRIYDLEFTNKKSILIIGPRDIDIPELELARKEDIEYINAHVIDGLKASDLVDEITQFFKSNKIKNIYISIDIDVLDPSIAPATGYPCPGGLSYRKLWDVLRLLAKEMNIIGFDLVEVSPNLDLPSGITSTLAAKIIIELISFISISKKKKERKRT